MMSFLGVPKAAFPAANSPQKLGQGGLSKKVQLDKGYSLHDWIALHNDRSKDLTSVGGGFRRVSVAELKAHNQVNNAWTVIRGKVYNLAPYMRYHPGGVDELMKVAGRDGTKQFDDVHAWVNIETMLERCVIGCLVADDVSAIRDNPKPSSAQVNERAHEQADPSIGQGQKPRFDWYQSKEVVHIVFMSKYDLNEENIIASLDSSGSLLEVIATLGPESSYVFKLRLLEKVIASQGIKVRVKKGNAQLTMVKAEEARWKSFGEILPGNGLVSSREVHFHECRVEEVRQVTHDTNLYRVQPPPAVHFRVPVGHHVIVKVNVEGMDLTNPYTVVRPLRTEEQASEDASLDILLMVKIYPEGVVTPHIGKLTVGDTLRVSEPQGSFDTACLDEASNIALIAMGTGFTPMASVISHNLASKSERNLHLLFSNKTEDDILWRTELEKAVQSSENRLAVQYALSSPPDSWSGDTGRLTLGKVREFLAPFDKSKLFVCICGSPNFNVQLGKWLHQLDLTPSQYHIFS